jgi:hypothetical protein
VFLFCWISLGEFSLLQDIWLIWAQLSKFQLSSNLLTSHDQQPKEINSYKPHLSEYWDIWMYLSCNGFLLRGKLVPLNKQLPNWFRDHCEINIFCQMFFQFLRIFFLKKYLQFKTNSWKQTVVSHYLSREPNCQYFQDDK